MRSVLSVSLLATGCFIMSSCNNSYQNNGDDGAVVQETYVHKYGVEVPSDDWQSRGEHGQVVSTLKNGVVVSKTYSAGILDGDTTYTFPHSANIEKVQTYSNGQVVRESTSYLSGAPMQEMKYNPDGNRLITNWYENGTPMSIETVDGSGLITDGYYYNYDHHIDSRVINAEGTRIVRDPFGQLESHDIIQEGNLALRTTYYPNGHPKDITPYRNGLADGQRKTFMAGGDPNTIEEWSNGNQTGTTIAYLNGEKYAEIPYVNGVKNGVERRYRDGNILSNEVTWENNIKHGPSTNYLGTAPQKDWFYKGKPVTQSNYELMTHTPTEQLTQQQYRR
jgi:antitoxin component YwqK of YwqJK toxin-antitoxin module